LDFDLGFCPRSSWGAYSAPQALSLDLRAYYYRGEKEGDQRRKGYEIGRK